jgi:hypothetical protein
MAKIIQITDFKDKYAITQNSFSTTSLQSFINNYELKYLYDLLGVTLGDLLYADITTPFAEPDTLIYQTIFNSLNYDDSNIQIRSNGIKEMLLGFIYFEYTRTQNVQNTITGNVQAQNEVSQLVNYGSTPIYFNYNEAVKTYRSIQIYINDNLTVYPTFNGLMKSYTSQFV